MNNKKLYLILLTVVMLGVSLYAVRYFGRQSGQAGPVNQNTAVPAVSANESGAAGGTGDSITPAASDKGKTGGETDKPAAGTSLNDSKRGWGLKKNDSHQQPEMPAGIAATLARYGAYWVGSPSDKSVYLTFDEGYENGHTPEILDILKKNNVKAAFFVTGHYLETNPELVKRMAAEGHIVGNHTDNHPSLPDITDAQIETELRTVEQDYEKVTGQKGMKYLRPPMGEYSERTLAATKRMGYHNIFWSVALVDWVPVPGGPDEVYRSVMGNLHNGALILLHAVSKDTTGALDRIINDVRTQGYTFKTLDDLTGN
ncbi:MAG: delta-lactam-biosynthetic de-N-acetylase [Eubacteriales bacterium]